jgi:hypothetical protein
MALLSRSSLPFRCSNQNFVLTPHFPHKDPRYFHQHPGHHNLQNICRPTFFFPVPVCAITASGVPGDTLVSMNRFSALCGWLVQRQRWRVRGWIWSSEQARSAMANSWLDYQRSLEKYEMGEGEMREISSIHPYGTSRVLLHDVKSYDMGPSRFTSHPRERCAADFYRP